jgi:hypothetical protein
LLSGDNITQVFFGKTLDLIIVFILKILLHPLRQFFLGAAGDQIFHIQLLERSYNDCLEGIKTDSRYTSYYEKTDKITAYYNYNSNGAICKDLYFGTDKRCTLIMITYSINFLNDQINNMNKDFVKISELKWKDYQNDAFIEINKSSEQFFLKIYK